MKRLLLSILLALLALPAAAQQANIALLAVDYDLDSATILYPILVGQGGSPYGAPISGNGCTLTTSGSSTTVEASATTCFTALNGPLAAGDVVTLQIPTGNTYRVIDSVTDGDTIVVNEAVNLASATRWGWYDFSAAATGGWVDVGGAFQVLMYAGYEQGDIATSVDVQFECRDGGLGQQAVQVYPDNSSGAAVTALTTANIGTLEGRVAVVVDVSAFSQCRIGVLRNGADASDATTNREKVTLKIIKTLWSR